VAGTGGGAWHHAMMSVAVGDRQTTKVQQALLIVSVSIGLFTNVYTIFLYWYSFLRLCLALAMAML
jgi:uncharacterized membrane-anchored protein